MIDQSQLLMIEPSAQVSEEPLIDELTRKMTAAWRAREESGYAFRGFHICSCRAWSDNHDHFVMVAGEKLKTNSLAIHYLAFHRADVPSEELSKVASLEYGEAEPTDEELHSPNSVRSRI